MRITLGFFIASIGLAILKTSDTGVLILGLVLVVIGGLLLASRLPKR